MRGDAGGMIQWPCGLMDIQGAKMHVQESTIRSLGVEVKQRSEWMDCGGQDRNHCLSKCAEGS